MKRTIAWSLALLLTITLAVSSAIASAQSSTVDLCGKPLQGAIGGIEATPTYDYSGYGSGSYPYGGYGPSGPYGEGDYYTPAPTPTATPIPQPENPVSKTCEFGKVQISVRSDRHGTYRIGDVIVVDVYLLTAPEVQINVDNLIRDKVLVFGNDSDFELAATPVLETTAINGRILHHIQLRVRSFSTEPILYVSADLLYATEVVQNDPAWKRLTTPPLMITTTRTLDQGDAPLEGDIDRQESGGTWLANVLLGLGGLLSGLAILLFAVPTIKAIVNRKRPVSLNEVAWRQLDHVFERGKAEGFSRQDYAQIAAILRGWLTREPATLREIEIVNDGDERLNDIRSALAKLDRIIFAPQGEELNLNVGELAQLERELERIVPRPVKEGKQ